MDQELSATVGDYLIRDGINGKIIKIISVTSEPAVPEGTNFLSIVEKTVVTVLLQSGSERKIRLITKRKPDGEARNAFLKHSGAFKKEIMIYSKILNAMDELISLENDSSGKLWCDMIGYTPYDFIAFEDLGAKAYGLFKNRGQYMDLDHAFLVMHNMGRFHGLSKVLFHNGLVEPSDIPPKYFMLADPKCMEVVFCHCLRGFCRVVKPLGSNWEEIADTFLDYSTRLPDDVVEVGKLPSDTSLFVMNHGDVWICNILFKYALQFPEKPIDMKFIDFQLSHYNTVSWDLTYFLYGSVDPEVRRENYDFLLETYLNGMTETAKLYELPLDQIPSLEAVKSDMDRILPFRLIVSFFFRAIIVSEIPFDMEKVMMNVELDENVGMDEAIITNPTYKDRSEEDFELLAAQLKEFQTGS